MNRRPLVIASALALSAWAATPSARASTARAVSIEELTRTSAFVVVATVREHRSAWVELSMGRRIVTYTRVTVDRAIVGSPARELWVRTLGGVVGDVGQLVPGEPRLHEGMTALMFLARAEDGLVINEMGQGLFIVERGADGALQLRPSPDVGTLIARTDATPSARALLAGAPLATGVLLAQRVRRRDAR